ncbi:MAG: extracellular solute-binding protein [Hamadaea sp.]|nr:extracellular solute-binding protein [Hamadaea sp.]
MNVPLPLSRRAALAGIGAAALSTVVGCGTGGSGTGTGTPGRLTVWFPGNSAPEIELVTKTLVPEFEAANSAKVEVTYVDWGQISPKLNAAFAGNTAPDLFGHGPAAAAGFAKAQRIAPLDAQVASLPADDRQDLAAYLDGGKVDGKQYMVPLSGQGVLIAYRKDLFEGSGAVPPKTWAEAYDAAQKLTVRKGATVTRAGLLLQSAKTQRVVQAFLTLLSSEGGSLLSADGTKATWNSPEGVKALTYFANLYSGTTAVSNQLGADFANQPAAQNPLATGEAAMVMVSAAQVTQIVKAKPELADKIAVLPPLSAATAKTFGGSGPGLFLNADSKNQELAWKFIAYMASKSVADRYAQAIGAVPVRASSLTGSYVSGQPLLKSFVQAGPAYVGSPNVASWVQVRDVLDKHVEQALAGKVSPKAALDAAAAEADPLLASK